MNNIPKTAKTSVASRRANEPKKTFITPTNRDVRDRQGMQSTPHQGQDRLPLCKEDHLPEKLRSLDMHHRIGQSIPEHQPRGALKLSSYLVSPDNRRAISAGARALSSMPVVCGSSRVSILPDGTRLLFLENPNTPESNDVAEFATNFGQNRHAVYLEAALETKPGVDIKLQRASVRPGRVVKYDVKDGLYPFILDQNKQLSISNVTAGINSITGAHYLLSLGLPVLFAGELVIAEGKIKHFTNASGQYMTPSEPAWIEQARKNPLFKDVPFIPYSPATTLATPTPTAVVLPSKKTVEQLISSDISFAPNIVGEKISVI